MSDVKQSGEAMTSDDTGMVDEQQMGERVKHTPTLAEILRGYQYPNYDSESRIPVSVLLKCAEDADALELRLGQQMTTSADYIAKCAALIEQRDQALELLAMLYDKWDNGDPCYQDADITCDSLGNAFKLTDEEENSVLTALKGNTK